MKKENDIPIGIIVEKPKLKLKVGSLPTPIERIEWSNSSIAFLPIKESTDKTVVQKKSSILSFCGKLIQSLKRILTREISDIERQRNWWKI